MEVKNQLTFHVNLTLLALAYVLLSVFNFWLSLEGLDKKQLVICFPG